jgi:hypothetical protein
LEPRSRFNKSWCFCREYSKEIAGIGLGQSAKDQISLFVQGRQGEFGAKSADFAKSFVRPARLSYRAVFTDLKHLVFSPHLKPLTPEVSRPLIHWFEWPVMGFSSKLETSRSFALEAKVRKLFLFTRKEKVFFTFPKKNKFLI